MKYPKIQTVYDRDKETFKVIPGQFRWPEFGLIQRWLVTEKIDGMNIRVLLHPNGEVEIRGRTDKAQFDPVVLKALKAILVPRKLQETFESRGANLVILYGEGYGPKIQKGGIYRDDVSFRLFDVRVGEWWLNWDNVQGIAEALGILTVPVLNSITPLYMPRDREMLEDRFWGFTVEGERPSSVVAYRDSGKTGVLPEGIVARTDPLLFTRRGDRVMWKLKFKDFPEE